MPYKKVFCKLPIVLIKYYLELMIGRSFLGGYNILETPKKTVFIDEKLNFSVAATMKIDLYAGVAT